jgi:predicted nucleic acid-binding protein
MVLVDSSIWIDHLHKPVSSLAMSLANGGVLTHPMLIGEIAMGSLKNRALFLRFLHRLPSIPPARDTEVMRFIEAKSLHGLGIGYIDAHLLASVRLMPDATLWTRDKRLDSIAGAMGLRHIPIP